MSLYFLSFSHIILNPLSSLIIFFLSFHCFPAHFLPTFNYFPPLTLSFPITHPLLSSSIPSFFLLFHRPPSHSLSSINKFSLSIPNELHPSNFHFFSVHTFSFFPLPFPLFLSHFIISLQYFLSSIKPFPLFSASLSSPSLPLTLPIPPPLTLPSHTLPSSILHFTLSLPSALPSPHFIFHNPSPPLT